MTNEKRLIMYFNGPVLTLGKEVYKGQASW